jgi:hypothetical protein
LNSVDGVNDLDLANHIATADAHFTALDASVDSLEGLTSGKYASVDTRFDGLDAALSAEIAATNGDVDSIDTRISAEISRATAAEASLTTRVAAEESARLAGDTYDAEVVTGVAGPMGAAVPFNTVASYRGGVYDLEVYVNGLKVEFTHVGGNAFELTLAYDLEATDNIMVIGVQS